MSTGQPAHDSPHPCPCCGHRTIDEPDSFDICSECWWEDDGQGEQDADVVCGGPNGSDSLITARERYMHEGGRLPGDCCASPARE